MKKSTQGNTNQMGYVSQLKKLSFYEENYILEPVDINADNHYLDFEGDINSDISYHEYSYYTTYETVA